MLNCTSYLRIQLSKAYEAAKKAISSADIEKEYIKKAKAGSQVARDTLFNLYIPFVISYARSSTYTMYSGDMGDLISAAAIGFDRAIELFDSTLGYEFGCYYKWHIKNAMNKELYGDSVVAVPENLQKPAKNPDGKQMLDEDGLPVNRNPVKVISGDSLVNALGNRVDIFAGINFFDRKKKLLQRIFLKSPYIRCALWLDKKRINCLGVKL